MTILIMAAAVLTIIVTGIILKNKESEVVAGILIISVIIMILTIIFTYVDIQAYYITTESIKVIEKNNAELETAMNNSVQEYYDLTTDVYSQINSGTLFTTYPEIKDEVTIRNMDQIAENNKELKKLELEKSKEEVQLKMSGLGFAIK